jgi:ATP-binding cassette, subfamily B, bacterial
VKDGRASLPQALRRLRHVAGRFAPEIRRERLLIGGAAVALVLEAAFRLAEPWPIKIVVDHVVEAGGGSPAGLLEGLDDATLIGLAAAAVVLFAGLRALAMYLSTVGLALAGNRVLTTIRGRVYAHLQRLSLAYHSRARQGDLITRVTGDINRLQEVTVTAALPLVVNTLTLLGMVGVMLWLSPQLALVVVAVLPLLALSLYGRAGRIRGAARRQRKREGALAATAAESLGAIRVVQALSLEDRLERRFSSQNQASLKEGVQTKRLSAGLERRVDVIAAVGTAVVLWQGARLVQSGAITPGDLVLFLFYLKTAFKPMRDLAKYTARLAAAAAAGERVLELLDTSPDIRDRPDAVPAPSLRGHVRLEGVQLAYEPRTPVIRGVDLDVEPGRQVALVGPSGGGKSTLASLLLRLYDPDEGRVVVDGRDIRDYTLDSLRGQIAVVLQESVLFAVTVRENIAWGVPEASEAEVVEAARLANAHEFIEALPDGYDTVLGERGATLSGGQRQRIAIARAAVRRAPIVVLDEPATGLDEQNERVVTDALGRLCHGRTSFLIAHDLTSVRGADTILYIEDGRVLERGTHEELLEAGGAYARTYAAQHAARSQGGSTSPRPEANGLRLVGSER